MYWVTHHHIYYWKHGYQGDGFLKSQLECKAQNHLIGYQGYNISDRPERKYYHLERGKKDRTYLQHFAPLYVKYNYLVLDYRMKQ